MILSSRAERSSCKFSRGSELSLVVVAAVAVVVVTSKSKSFLRLEVSGTPFDKAAAVEESSGEELCSKAAVVVLEEEARSTVNWTDADTDSNPSKSRATPFTNAYTSEHPSIATIASL